MATSTTVKVDRSGWARALRFLLEELERGTVAAASVELPTHGVGRFTVVMQDGSEAPLPGLLVNPDEEGEAGG